MELEIKHIAPYLPYGLKVIKIKDNIKQSVYSASFRGVYFIDSRASLYRFSEIKPILLPLERLNEFKVELALLGYQIDGNGMDNIIQDIKDGRAEYDIMQLCFEKHIDVFNLIPSGLAIDKTTLNINR